MRQPSPYRGVGASWRIQRDQGLSVPLKTPQGALKGRALKRPPPLFGGGLPAQGT
jgi:hypothetical protein